MTPDDPRHGTHAGRRAHEKAGQEPCLPCRESNALYQRRYRKIRALYGDRRLPTLGTARRIHALNRLGWSTPLIADLLGMSPKQLWLTTTQTYVTRDNADRIARIYEELSMSLPPTATKSQRISVARTRSHAEREGYPPPLAWDNIDDPDEKPAGWAYQPRNVRNQYADDYDPVVVQRLLEGDRVPATAAERAEALAQWVADGGSERELCAHHGWKTGRYGALTVIQGGAA